MFLFLLLVFSLLHSLGLFLGVMSMFLVTLVFFDNLLSVSFQCYNIVIIIFQIFFTGCFLLALSAAA